MNNVKITVFTPTYNRVSLLPKLYESLLHQDFDDFEWIIVDDDSSDNTEEVVKKWIKNTKKFNIIYYKQSHGGKHRAINKGIELASGDYFFNVDSDDYLVHNALKLISDWINSIVDVNNICGVAGLKIQTNGEICGGIPYTFGKNYIDATNFEREIFKLNKDKAEVYKTSILKEYKFPEYNNEFFVTEDYVYLQIAAKGLKIRWFNEPIYVCEYLEDGLSKIGANEFEGHKKNFNGYCDYINKCVKYKPLGQKLMHLKEFNLTLSYLGIPLNKRANYINYSLIKYILILYVFSISISLFYKLQKKWRLLIYALFYR